MLARDRDLQKRKHFVPAKAAAFLLSVFHGSDSSKSTKVSRQKVSLC